MFEFLKPRTAPPEAEPDPELDSVLARSDAGPVLLFKHSLSCGTSYWARRAVAGLDAPDDPHVVEIVVQEARALSNRVADHFRIRHETPQAILVVDRRAVWNASHLAITREAIRAAAASVR